MNTKLLANSELMLNEDGSIYHLNLLPGEIANTIILVGDPQRATVVSEYFDAIELCKTKREFITYTGRIGQKRLSVVGTGIGAGNIDIVINELDAIVNVDFSSREIKPSLQQLDIIRLGTTGATVAEIDVDSLIVSDYGCGFDGLLHYYQYAYNEQEASLMQQIKTVFSELPTIMNNYVCQGAKNLCQRFTKDFIHGITFTCAGFYGPQNRRLRAPVITYDIYQHLAKINFSQLRITNIEMETAITYGIARLLGHNCCSISAVIANRETLKVSKNPNQAISSMIEKALALIV